MTIEEKLTHFYDTSVEEARRQAEKEVQEHKESLDAACLLYTSPSPRDRG